MHPALEAAQALNAGGISTGVVDMHTVKPLDADAVARAAQRSPIVLTVEEHNVIGGLGGAVAEVVAEHGYGTRVIRHGVKDEYALIGPRPTCTGTTSSTPPVSRRLREPP